MCIIYKALCKEVGELWRSAVKQWTRPNTGQMGLCNHKTLSNIDKSPLLRSLFNVKRSNCFMKKLRSWWREMNRNNMLTHAREFREESWGDWRARMCKRFTHLSPYQTGVSANKVVETKWGTIRGATRAYAYICSIRV